MSSPAGEGAGPGASTSPDAAAQAQKRGESSAASGGGASNDDAAAASSGAGTSAEQVLRTAVAGSTAANDEYEWEMTGHEFIGARVARLYTETHTYTFGRITKWLPPDDEDEALFHMMHDDGDEEDLNEAEVRDALELYAMTDLAINDPVAVNWKGQGKWWPARVCNIKITLPRSKANTRKWKRKWKSRQRRRIGKVKGHEAHSTTPELGPEGKPIKTIKLFSVRYDDGDTESNIPLHYLYKRLDDAAAMRKKVADVLRDRKIPKGHNLNPHDAHKLVLTARSGSGFVCDLCNVDYGPTDCWRCEVCDYDCCQACVEEDGNNKDRLSAVGPRSPPPPSEPASATDKPNDRKLSIKLRRTSKSSAPACKSCSNPAVPGNYGFCREHRTEDGIIVAPVKIQAKQISQSGRSGRSGRSGKRPWTPEISL